MHFSDHTPFFVPATAGHMTIKGAEKSAVQGSDTTMLNTNL
jgi:hypothetical protein